MNTFMCSLVRSFVASSCNNRFRAPPPPFSLQTATRRRPEITRPTMDSVYCVRPTKHRGVGVQGTAVRRRLVMQRRAGK